MSHAAVAVILLVVMFSHDVHPNTGPQNLGGMLTEAAFENVNEAELLEKIMKEMSEALDDHHIRTSRRSSRFGLFSQSSRNSFKELRQNIGSIWRSRTSGSQRESGLRKNPESSTLSQQTITAAESARLSYMGVPKDMRRNRELHSIVTVLESRRASYYLRQYMAQSLTLENYMFYQEVESSAPCKKPSASSSTIDSLTAKHQTASTLTRKQDFV